jgi:hypothetical protein
MFALAPGTGGLLAPENQSFKPVLTLGTDIFEYGHVEFLPLVNTNIRGLASSRHS